MKLNKKYAIFFDNQFLNVTDAFIHAFTPGRFKAYGVFETLRVDGQEVYDFDGHLKRMKTGLNILKIELPVTFSRLKIIAFKVLKSNSFVKARLRIMVWQIKNHRHLMVVCIPYQKPSQEKYKQGYHVGIYPQQIRLKANQSELKSLDYSQFYKAFGWATKKEFDEALLLNQRGKIFEGSRSNVFAVKDNILYTPPLKSGCLNGIIRRKVLKLAKNKKIRVKETVIDQKFLAQAEEIFLTNSLLEIMPVTRLQGKRVGSSRVGKITSHLRNK